MAFDLAVRAPTRSAGVHVPGPLADRLVADLQCHAAAGARRLSPAVRGRGRPARAGNGCGSHRERSPRAARLGHRLRVVAPFQRDAAHAPRHSRRWLRRLRDRGRAPSSAAARSTPGRLCCRRGSPPARRAMEHRAATVGRPRRRTFLRSGSRGSGIHGPDSKARMSGGRERVRVLERNLRGVVQLGGDQQPPTPPNAAASSVLGMSVRATARRRANPRRSGPCTSAERPTGRAEARPQLWTVRRRPPPRASSASTINALPSRQRSTRKGQLSVRWVSSSASLDQRGVAIDRVWPRTFSVLPLARSRGPAAAVDSPMLIRPANRSRTDSCRQPWRAATE